jgi:hypothetical protein
MCFQRPPPSLLIEQVAPSMVDGTGHPPEITRRRSMSFSMHLSAPAASGPDPRTERTSTTRRFHLDYATWYARIAGHAGKSAPTQTAPDESTAVVQQIGSADAVRLEQHAA